MAKVAFAKHQVTLESRYVWRCRQPRSSFHAFRVSWSPGALTITGDLGSAVYEVWPGFAHPYDAARLVARAEYDYLTSKTKVTDLFDSERTIANLIHLADEYMREWGDFRLWEKIVRTWGDYDDNPRNGAHQMRAASRLREEQPSAERMYYALGDSELLHYSPPPQTRWHYEALKLWAAEAIRTEPLTSKAQTKWRRFRAHLRSYKTHPVIFRPEVYTRAANLNGSRYWRRDAKCWRAVNPWKLGRLDLSGLGLWRDQGSTFPGGDEFLQRYGFAKFGGAA